MIPEQTVRQAIMLTGQGQTVSEIARRLGHDRITSGLIQDSAPPPAATTSAAPTWSSRQAQASASAPDAQAYIGACTPARSASPTWAAGPLGMIIGMSVPVQQVALARWRRHPRPAALSRRGR
jgi:hypothetical protein